MKPARRRLFTHLAYTALALAAPRIVFGAQILAVRVWPAQEYTRITIESDTALATKHQVISNPRRLLVDIEGLELDAALRELVGKVKADDPYIAQIRIGQFAPKVVRLVLDLKAEVAPQVFTLAPVAAYRHRLVFDLFPSKPIDPLDKLLVDLMQNVPPRTATASAPAPISSPTSPPVAPPVAPPAAPSTAPPAASDPLGELIAQQSRQPSGVGTGPEQPKPQSRPPRPPTPSVQPTKPPIPISVPVPSPQTASAPTDRSNRLMIVALDPGHGGEDPGAVGPSGTYEKNVVLSIARMVKERLDGLPNTRAVLTRDGDFFVPLAERVRKARRVQADLFVSIHADAFIEPRARGASVFALSEKGATSAQARWLADKENAADNVGGINVRTQDQQVARALLDMSTTAQIKDSLTVGRAVLSEIGAFQRLHKAKVEQAGFAVLKAPDIPSILIETAFISNPEEEQLLRDRGHQERVADAIVRGISRYFAANPPLAKNRSV